MTRPAAIAAARTWRRDAPKRPAATVEILDRRLAARAGLALVLVNVRYWSRVAPLARSELERWRQRARTIEDPVLRALAVSKLDEEGFNAEAAAMLATLAPRAHRRRTVEAIVAAEVLYDYLDGLTEFPAAEARGDGERLFTAFTDAVDPSAVPDGDYYRHHSRAEGVYLAQLVASVRHALAGLPASTSLGEVLQSSAARGAEAQLRMHAMTPSTSEQLRLWAERRAADTPLEWREYLAGAACSVLAVHALIAAASDRHTTNERALELDRIYLLISVLPTVLDSVIDRELDASAGRAGYIQHYDDCDLLAGRLAGVIEDAVHHARNVPDGAHHVMTLVGVVAYYLSAPTASDAFARPVTVRIGRQLRPLLAPTMSMMRAWRAAKRLRGRWRARSSARATAYRSI
jgi:tetraprenyl-beta-curcumene synthase